MELRASRSRPPPGAGSGSDATHEFIDEAEKTPILFFLRYPVLPCVAVTVAVFEHFHVSPAMIAIVQVT